MGQCASAYTAPYPPPLLSYPQLPPATFRHVPPAKVKLYEFVAMADGKKKIFTDADQLAEYQGEGILNPATVSYINLFINGVLQPRANYRVEEGKLTLLTEDAPPQGAPIMLQMVKVEG